ncbi:response regulator transcription factor [Mucilaginibacter mali]|uniref:Response regulator transcription factor n=1 Tax=Mucilaginibacter mali TaxID=2740462 RepID=A0A7D4Q471_9SPHI|nr:response regulator transcription factor [Mucilaginibacter mali]QKJ32766.1 response regulator transcription factor [Mucilaginibacter mali]
MQHDISILIIEDDAMWSQSLKNNLVDFGFTVVGTPNTFQNAITALNSLNYDIALLDINLHTRNEGIELGKMLTNLYRKPFIFITGNFDKQTMDQAVEAKPSAYLTKPVNPVSLYVTIQSAINNFNNKTVAIAAKPGETDSDSFFVKLGDKYKKINWKDVVYLTSDKNYTVIFNAVDGTEYYIRSSMNRTLQYIVPKHLQGKFIQVNRAETVQLSFITELIADEVYTPYKTFTVSENYIRDLKKQLNIIA